MEGGRRASTKWRPVHQSASEVKQLLSLLFTVVMTQISGILQVKNRQPG